MASIQDEKGINQGFKEARALEIRTLRRAERIVEAIKDRKPSLILEIGCGIGDLSIAMANLIDAQLVAVDASQKFIDMANEKSKYIKNLKFKKAELNKQTDFNNFGKFDVICGNGILHHLYRDLGFYLEKFKLLLNSGGKIVFWEPNIYNPYIYTIFSFDFFRRLAKLDPDEMAFSAKFIQNKLTLSGYVTAKAQFLDFLLPNTPDYLIQPTIKVGSFLEKNMVTRWASQSIFIEGELKGKL